MEVRSCCRDHATGRACGAPRCAACCRSGPALQGRARFSLPRAGSQASTPAAGWLPAGEHLATAQDGQQGLLPPMAGQLQGSCIQRPASPSLGLQRLCTRPQRGQLHGPVRGDAQQHVPALCRVSAQACRGWPAIPGWRRQSSAASAPAWHAARASPHLSAESGSGTGAAWLSAGPCSAAPRQQQQHMHCPGAGAECRVRHALPAPGRSSAWRASSWTEPGHAAHGRPDLTLRR